jgi:archaellum component FlaC
MAAMPASGALYRWAFLLHNQLMSDEPESLVLRYLRRIDEKVDRLSDDVRDIKTRLTAVEENLVGVHRRLDRLELRVERIEKRLDLVEIP